MNRMLDLFRLGHPQICGLPDPQVDGVSARSNRYCNWQVVLDKLDVDFAPGPEGPRRR
jgi:hypothetical protein